MDRLRPIPQSGVRRSHKLSPVCWLLPRTLNRTLAFYAQRQTPDPRKRIGGLSFKLENPRWVVRRHEDQSGFF